MQSLGGRQATPRLGDEAAEGAAVSGGLGLQMSAACRLREISEALLGATGLLSRSSVTWKALIDLIEKIG